MNTLKNNVRAIVDPHDTRVLHPKYPDGALPRTAGLRFRQLDNISLDDTDYSYIILFSGVGNNASYVNKASDPSDAATMLFDGYINHADTPENNASINQWRSLGSQVKLNLLNSPDESDGMFEAVRVSYREALPLMVIGVNRNYMVKASAVALCNNMENDPSYVQGKLRDIHKYNFRLNYESAQNDLDFKGIGTRIDNDFDVIIVRLTGRKNESSPSLVSVDSCNIQEVEYKRGSSLARMMTNNYFNQGLHGMLSKIRYQKSGFKFV